MANGEFNHRLSDYIVVIRGIISREMCQQVVDLYKDNSKWDWAGTTGGMNLDHRKVKQMWISHPDVAVRVKNMQKWTRRFSKLCPRQRTCTLKLFRKTRDGPHPQYFADEGYQILHYSEGYYFKEHCDNSGGMSRILTCTLNISDDHDGGSVPLPSR
jgi:hypothetical protein